MISTWLSDFIQYLRYEKRYSQHTLIAYDKDLHQFFDYTSDQFSITEITEVTHFHIRSWLAEMKDGKHSARTLNRKLSALTSFYKYLLKQGAVEKNPVKKVPFLFW